MQFGYKLNTHQLRRIADVYMSVGHVSFGSVVIPAVVDKPNTYLIALGLIVALSLWILSVMIEGRRK